MLYREWMSLRYKLALWAAIYFGLMIVFLMSNVWFGRMAVNIYRQDEYEIYNTLFGGWLKVIILLTPFLAWLGPVDLFSEEAGKGTISFLLTRPLRRSRIYATKMLPVMGGLMAIVLSSSLLVLAVDQSPRQGPVFRWVTEGCGVDSYCSGWAGGGLEPSRPAELLPAALALGIVLTGGALVMCGTGFLSIYTRNMLQALAASSPLVLLMYTFQSGSGPFPRTSQFMPLVSESLTWAETGPHLLWLAVLAALGVMVFWAGLLVFSRKEF